MAKKPNERTSTGKGSGRWFPRYPSGRQISGIKPKHPGEEAEKDWRPHSDGKDFWACHLTTADPTTILPPLCLDILAPVMRLASSNGKHKSKGGTQSASLRHCVSEAELTNSCDLDLQYKSSPALCSSPHLQHCRELRYENRSRIAKKPLR